MPSFSDSSLVRQLGALFQASTQWLAGLGDDRDISVAPAQAHLPQTYLYQQYLEALIASSPIAITLLDAQQRITTCNSAFEKLFGYPQAEVVEQPVEEFIHTDFTSPGVPVMHTLTQRRRKDGALREVEVMAVPIRRQGTLMGAVALYDDVTERHRLETQLKLAQAALNAAANAILICDRAGTITWVNPAFTCLTGYTSAEACGQNMRLLKSGKHASEYYRHLWQTVLAGEVWQGGTINRRKDGTLYTEEQTIAPVRDEQGTITHFISVKQPVTLRQYIESDLGRLAHKAEASVGEP